MSNATTSFSVGFVDGSGGWKIFKNLILGQVITVLVRPPRTVMTEPVRGDLVLGNKNHVSKP